MTTSPNFSVDQLIDPIPHTEVAGVYPNPVEYIPAEISRLLLEAQSRFRADDEAIVVYFQAQLQQAFSMINGLAGGEDLLAALELLEQLRNVVDADGNGVLDALTPFNQAIAALQARVHTTETQLAAQQTSLNSLQTNQDQMSQGLTALNTGVSTALETAISARSAAVAVGNNMGRNMQAIRDAFQSINIDFSPIVLPDPIFATTNVLPDDGAMDPSIV